MGNKQCCGSEDSNFDKLATSAVLQADEATPVADDAPATPAALAAPAAERSTPAAPAAQSPPKPAATGTYEVVLDKSHGGRMGLDVDFLLERTVLPVMSVTGGLAEQWNKVAPADKKLKADDCIIEVNGVRQNVSVMLDRCKDDTVLNLTLARGVSHDSLVADVKQLIQATACGPTLVRLAFLDTGSLEQRSGGPNGALRFTFGLPGADPGAAAGHELLGPIAAKYTPLFVSNSDLWALAANVAIKAMGGPEIPTKFGRADASSAAQAGQAVERLPGGSVGASRLRSLLALDDRAIVALAGAPAGCAGKWTGNTAKFDNSRFAEMLKKTPGAQALFPGACTAFASDPAFKAIAEEYASDQGVFFSEFARAWVQIQQRGCENALRTVL